MLYLSGQLVHVASIPSRKVVSREGKELDFPAHIELQLLVDTIVYNNLEKAVVKVELPFNFHVDQSLFGKEIILDVFAAVAGGTIRYRALETCQIRLFNKQEVKAS